MNLVGFLLIRVYVGSILVEGDSRPSTKAAAGRTHGGHAGIDPRRLVVYYETMLYDMI